MVTASPADPVENNDHDGLPADLAASLIHLLERAKRQLGDDPKLAVGAISQASSLLQFEIDRRNARAEPGPTKGALAAWQANRVRTYVDAHLDATIQIRDLAAVARRSTAYFCRAFKRTFGQTPHAFVVERRLHRATELMLTSDASLAEVALACGFADQAHLCKMFRQHNGQTPATWRRERRDMQAAAPANLDRETQRPDLAA